ncbi:MAG: hypothetical protein ACRC0L_06590, partial [Angustibacter sp.]
TNTAAANVPGVATPAAPAPGKFAEQVRLLGSSAPVRLEITGANYCPMYLVPVQQKAFSPLPNRGCFFLR